MRATLRRRLERAERVRDFLRAHKTEGAEAAALTRLEELLARAQVLAAQQMKGVVARRGSVAQREEVRAQLHGKLLRYLTGVGAVAARENAQLAAQFRLPQFRVPNLALVTLARGMLEKAIEHKDLLVTRGLSESVLTDIEAALVEFEQTLEASRAARREHVGASGELKTVLGEISEQVRLLDGLVRYRFGDDAELMTAWASVKNVVGPFKARGEGEGSGDVKAA
jgi:hypothetical protein